MPVTTLSRPTPYRPRAARPARALPDLLDLTRRFATDLDVHRLGPIRFGDPARPGDPEARWHVRVHADDVVDVWVISWLPSQGTRLHDHGGSSGAFTVTRGVLTEAVWDPGLRRDRRLHDGRLRDRRHPAGTSAAFGPDRIHDVRNLDPAPAVSVHAYSPPLTRMGYFDVTGGSLQSTTIIDTSDPEAGA